MEDEIEITLLPEGDNGSDTNTAPETTDFYEGSNEPASITITRELSDEEPPSEDEEDMAEITKTEKSEGSTELDKFKRRLIRVIARLMRNDEAPTEEFWSELTKQTGCNCKLLWDRMQALTIKKLRKLLIAEDTISNITKIAQLNSTDWLMFDLVLAHEQMDVIGQDILDADAKISPKVLEDLFATVVIYNLENLSGDELIKAWFQATKDYNGTKRQCSPILLQRRWYQLKARVREKFYQFWFHYRGSQRHLPEANEFKPSALEMEIAKHFKYIITNKFPTWEELIDQQKVALPEDFERLQLAKRRIFRKETGPDLEVIEPHVETIDLEQYSDSEESKDSEIVREPKKNINLGIVKTEKVDEISDDDDVHILESMHIPLEASNNPEGENDLEDSNDARKKNSASVVRYDDASTYFKELSGAITANENSINAPYIDHVNITQPGQNTDVENNEMLPIIIHSTTSANTVKDVEIMMPKISHVSSAAIDQVEPAEDAVDDEINNILENVAEKMSSQNIFQVLPSPLRAKNTPYDLNNLEKPEILEKDIMKDEIHYKDFVLDEKNMKNRKDEKLLHSFTEVPNDVNILDGIVLEDDGIEFIDEDDDIGGDLTNTVKTEEIEDCTNTPTIDLKLLLTPLVYTKKIDDMDVFRFIDYNSVKDKRVIENSENESKPVDKNSVKMEEISQEHQSALLSDEFSDSATENQSEDDEGPEMICMQSWLLRKPKKLSYNPIQLCKNPDFNTRLKRLSAGFFSSERNRYLLKECKPLTIDLHKSFESKLSNNTLYLKGTASIQSEMKRLEKNTEETPVENLINNVINDILGPVERTGPSAEQLSSHQPTLHSYLVERKKVITLPDKEQMRLVNEKLLTAEVTPMQVSSVTKPPVSIVPKEQHSQWNIPVSAQSTTTTICVDSSTSISNQVNLTSNSAVEVTRSKLNAADTVNSDAVNLNLPYKKNTKIANKNKSLDSLKTGYKALKGTVLNQQQQNMTKGKKQVNPIELSWNPKIKKCIIPEDRLLTGDTVDKILKVCNGGVDEMLTPIKSLKKFNKAVRRKALREKSKVETLVIKKVHEINNDVSLIPNDKEVSFISEQEPINNPYKDTSNVEEQPEDQPYILPQSTVKFVKKPKYCCWAREKIAKLNEEKKSVRKHLCPRPLCNCCCRIELVEKMTEIREGINKSSHQVEETITPPVKITVSSSQRHDSPTQTVNNCAQISLKVSVGTNTDYDKEFETDFAANLAEWNSRTNCDSDDKYSASSIKVSYSSNINKSYGQTQTSMNLMALDKNTNSNSNIFSNGGNSYDNNNEVVTLQERESPNVVLKKIPVIPHSKNNLNLSFKEDNSNNPITIRNTVLLDKFKPTGLHLSKSEFSGNICKDIKNQNMISDKNNPHFKLRMNESLTHSNFSVTPDLSRQTCNNSSKLQEVLQQNDKKNDKILFVTNDRMKNTLSPMPICLGKNKILLCSFANVNLKNQSNIDDVSSNNPSTDDVPSGLPDGVRIILLPNKELAVSIDPGIELDASQLAYLPVLLNSIQKQLTESNFIDNVMKTDSDPLSTKVNDQDVTVVNSSNDSDIKLDDRNQADNENTKTPVKVSCREQEVCNTDKMEVDDEQNKKEDCGGKNADDCTLDNVIDLKDSSDSNKKTILSDLMEMSGISAEDAHATRNASPTKQKSELSPTPVKESLQTLIFNHNRKNLNSPLYENPMVQMALSRCPELCIVFSYQELRYASENNAQFYKMDINTGIVVPIEVVIKKQMPGPRRKQDTSLKSVIDLTDDPEEGETMNIKEQNDTQKDRAVPVQLYSSIKPNIVRRGQSLLVRSVSASAKTVEKVKKKKMIRVIKLKYKRKQPLDCLESINLDSDDEPKEETPVDTSSEAIPEKTKSDDSDSDDEPLAFKAKRMRQSLEPNQSTTPESSNQTIEDRDHVGLVDTQNIEKITEDENEVTECATQNPTIDGTPEEVNDQGLDTTSQLDPVELGPLTYDDNIPDCSEEDCILGV